MTTTTLFPATASGNGTAALQLTTDTTWTTIIGNTVIGGIVRGRAGCGKTTFVHRLVESLHAEGHTVLLADPLAHSHTDTELPRATWVADSAASVAEWLSDLDTELTDRINGEPFQVRGAPAPKPFFVVIDHAEFVLDDHKNVRFLERLATLGGRMGIGVILSGRSFPGLWHDQFESGNLLTFTYPRRVNTAGWGISQDDVTEAPQHFRSPTGEITGIDLDA